MVCTNNTNNNCTDTVTLITKTDKNEFGSDRPSCGFCGSLRFSTGKYYKFNIYDLKFQIYPSPFWTWKMLVLLQLSISLIYTFLYTNNIINGTDISPRQIQTGSPKLKVGIYYETLCPDSARFIRAQLVPLMKAGGEEVLEIQFIPYGKASVSECGMK